MVRTELPGIAARGPPARAAVDVLSARRRRPGGRRSGRTGADRPRTVVGCAQQAARRGWYRVDGGPRRGVSRTVTLHNVDYRTSSKWAARPITTADEPVCLPTRAAGPDLSTLRATGTTRPSCRGGAGALLIRGAVVTGADAGRCGGRGRPGGRRSGLMLAVRRNAPGSGCSGGPSRRLLGDRPGRRLTAPGTAPSSRARRRAGGPWASPPPGSSCSPSGPSWPASSGTAAPSPPSSSCRRVSSRWAR